jgi:transposase
MERYRESDDKRKRIFVGIDLHRLQWFVTVMTVDIELFSGSIPGTWDSLRTLLERYRGCEMQVVYEAGYFGFWLHDRLIEYGADCIVTPPSLVPQQYGNHVKTDRRDSRKLARLLAKGLLRSVWVPSLEERYERQVLRRRRQLIGDRVRVQNRIKAELRFYGIDVPGPTGQWTKVYVEKLHRLRFDNQWIGESFERLLEERQFLSSQVQRQTKVLTDLAESADYRERVKILRSVPGIGLIAAMEILLELQDVSRFRRADQLAAYVGLTPSQYSSADKVRMGRITCIGKSSLRGTMVERAIIAIARMTLLRTRRMLLDNRTYAVGLAA